MQVSIIYHSATGNTKSMADHVAKGINDSGLSAVVMSIDNLNVEAINTSKAVIFGCPTYFGNMSWQMAQCLDTLSANLNGKLGGVFASCHWPGGGGYELAEMNMIAAMLVKGMMIYSGGVVNGAVPTHFGAVSNRAPVGFDADRCIKLGINIANKVKELNNA